MATSPQRARRFLRAAGFDRLEWEDLETRVDEAELCPIGDTLYLEVAFRLTTSYLLTREAIQKADGLGGLFPMEDRDHEMWCKTIMSLETWQSARDQRRIGGLTRKEHLHAALLQARPEVARWIQLMIDSLRTNLLDAWRTDPGTGGGADGRQPGLEGSRAAEPRIIFLKPWVPGHISGTIRE